jgi:hypothetical protein
LVSGPAASTAGPRVLKFCIALTALSLSIDFIEGCAVAAIASALELNTKTRCLNMAFNTLGDEGVPGVAATLNRIVQERNSMEGNRHGMLGAERFAGAFEINVCLRQLELVTMVQPQYPPP